MSLPFRHREGASLDHDRARAGLSDGLAGPLPEDERRWVEEHLASCTACRTAAAAYESDRTELRALRDQRPEPPRDLWARTAAAIERESAPRRQAPFVRRSRPSPIPLGAISGALVVAAVIGASLLSGNPAPTPPAPGTPAIMAVSLPPGSPGSLAPTPLAVARGEVEWMVVNASGEVEVHSASYFEVCPSGAECKVLEEPSPESVDVQEPPRVAVISPDDETLVVVDAETKGEGGDITVVAAPTDTAPATTPTATPTAAVPPPARSPGPATPEVTASIAPTATATAGATASSEVVSPELTASPDPSGTATPPATATPGPTATAVDDPSPTARGSEPPATDDPATEPPATDPPATDPPVTPVPPEATPSASPAPEQLAIAADVVVVGETAAFSPDGTRFAFSARPADGSRGPDIYVWTVGDAEATRVTSDERSVFSGWLTDLVLGSRVVPVGTSGSGASGLPDLAAGDGSTSAVFVIDPETGQQQEISGAPFWRPTVDPTRTRAVYWEGTLSLSDDAAEWRPSRGRLAVGPWPDLPALGAPSTFSPPTAPDATAEPDPSPDSLPSLPAVQAPDVAPGAGQTLRIGPIADWDAQWDETGTRLAVWIADPNDPETGTLSLYLVDEATGEIDVAGAPLKDRPARPGFSIGDGRLAWATPSGQDGEGSQVEVIAWRGDEVGSIETQPGDEQVVVIR